MLSKWAGRLLWWDAHYRSGQDAATGAIAAERPRRPPPINPGSMWIAVNAGAGASAGT